MRRHLTKNPARLRSRQRPHRSARKKGEGAKDPAAQVKGVVAPFLGSYKVVAATAGSTG